MTDGKNPAPMETANLVRTHQRAWLAETRARVRRGEAFVICNGDEFEDLLNVMDIPVIVINYWNSIIAVKGMSGHYYDILSQNGYNPHRFALGLACTMEGDPKTAPWGGLPKPAMILGSTKSDLEMKVLETWAQEYGCPLFPLEFALDPVSEKPIYPPPSNWWEKMRDHWDDLIDPRRLDLRVEQEKALITLLEVTTGKTLSTARLKRSLELVNEQMAYWGKARDLIAQTQPCPVSLRDQLAMYQAMWHRGTEKGRDFLKLYYEEVKARVEKGISSNADEKFRLMWLEATPPSWGKYIEKKYKAVCVCSLFSSIPIDCYYRRTLDDDPLRTIAGRHMVLFLETPEWRLKDAKLHQCDAVVEAAQPGVPSFNKQLFEASGMPLCEIPYDQDTEEVRSILSDFIESRLMT